MQFMVRRKKKLKHYNPVMSKRKLKKKMVEVG